MAGNKRGLILQERDRHLFSELAHLRVLTLSQIMTVAGFNSLTRAKSRTLMLVRGGFLLRWFIGSAGCSGRKAVYALTRKGARVAGVLTSPPSRKLGATLALDLFSEHQLYVNDVCLRLRYGTTPTGVSLVRWTTFAQPVSKAAALIPDAYFELRGPSGNRACFLEVDLGGEALRVWQKKTQGYLSLAVSGEFAQEFHQPKFSVLVLAPSARRLGGIRKTVLSQTDKIFWFSTFEQLTQAGLWSPIWIRPSGGHLLALMGTST